MSEFGHFSLCLSWILATIGCAAGVIVGARAMGPMWVSFVRRITVLCAVGIGCAIFSLGYSFVTDDYSLQYVWQYSNADMAPIYKVTAIWGGMDGSMLLWAFLLSISIAIAAVKSDSWSTRLTPWILGFANSSICFFLTVTVFFTNPFRYVIFRDPATGGADALIPMDGNGLNPLLQNEYMAAHPPLLYLGFTGFAIPYAFCMAALASGHISNEWIRLTRRWTLVAWTFLTAGIVLGGHWAYLELGWGGFWAWDPVENASFLPWLTGTAFLHSVMVQERKGMLKVWNISLVVLTYALTVFGTFLTRSGIVQSVHAFASTDIGIVFLWYLGLLIGLAVGLIIYRWHLLRPERSIESVFSREAVFLLNNLVLLSICFAILWGVMFPVFSEALTGVKQTVGIPFFNSVNIPLFLGLIFLMGVGPVIAWRRSSPAQLAKIFLKPFLFAFGVGIVLVWAGVQGFYPILAYSLSCFVLGTIVGEFNSGLRVQNATSSGIAWNPKNIGLLFNRHRVRYGAHVIHFGVVVMTIAITASMAHKIEKEFTLAPGESFSVGRFSLKLDEFHEVSTPNYKGVQARTIVSRLKDNAEIGVLSPELRYYPRNDENTTEVALRMGPREDIYVVLAGLDDSGTRASLKVFINPLQIWLWYGAMIMVAGGIFLIVPQSRAVRQAIEKDKVLQAV